ncbi:(2Fe-2S)-binding protein [Phycicoccus flavus]|uniref:(2Fe-2S)-binding protein n=1 Tax=Phycicoccus flavus TaxID=2502783 RepID=UPI000FEB752F|nr:(2Fe-2S)-binding protein [Phycicoccus flavus]NHA67966.1 (2Fe-2S)-binding protein [Phycicoccus flavus]
MHVTTTPPPTVRWVRRLEELEPLDDVVDAAAATAGRLFGDGARGRVLRGEWFGHALHPALTDVVIGSWGSATVLDLVGGEEAAPAARTLVGVGLLAVGPTAWTGWAEWSASGRREQRVGVVHVAAVGTAIGAYAGSYLARRRGRRRLGVALGLVGAGAVTAGAFLGGHLAVARGVGSRHPAFAD